MVHTSSATGRLRRWLVVEYPDFGYDRSGGLHPKKPLLERAAHKLGFGFPDDQRLTWAVALILSGLVGVTYWTPFLETWGMETLGVDLRLMGAAVSIAVMVSLYEGFILVHDSLINHPGYRWEMPLGIGLVTLLAVSEFTCIALGLSSQHSAVLNPSEAYLPYLAGWLVTAVNGIAGYVLARNRVRRKAAHSLAMQMLTQDPYRHQVEAAFKELQTLREQAEIETEVPTLGIEVSNPQPKPLPASSPSEPEALPQPGGSSNLNKPNGKPQDLEVKA